MTPIPLEDILRFERGELEEEAAGRVREQLKSDPQAAAWLDWLGALRAGARGMDPQRGADAPSGSAPATFGEIAQLATGSLGPDEAARVREKLLATPDGYDLLESALEEFSILQGAHATTPRETGAPILQGPRPASGEISPGGTHRGRPRAIFGVLAAAMLVAVGLWLWQRPASGDQDPAVKSVATLAEKAAMSVPTLRAATSEAGLRAYAEGDFPRAASLLRAATAEDPGAGTIWLYLGSAELLLGNLSGAADAFEVARAKCEPSYHCLLYTSPSPRD